MSDAAGGVHCYFAAQQALLEGRDPDTAAAHSLRPDGVLTAWDRWIADTAVAAARRDLGKQRRADVFMAAINSEAAE